MTLFGRALLSVTSYLECLAGLVVAAALLADVSLSVVGAVEAAAVLLAFGLADMALLRRAARHPEKLWLIPTALFVASPALFIGGLLAAVAVVPGLSIDGTWAYVAAEVIVWGVALGLGWITD